MSSFYTLIMKITDIKIKDKTAEMVCDLTLKENRFILLIKKTKFIKHDHPKYFKRNITLLGTIQQKETIY